MFLLISPQIVVVLSQTRSPSSFILGFLAESCWMGDSASGLLQRWISGSQTCFTCALFLDLLLLWLSHLVCWMASPRFTYPEGGVLLLLDVYLQQTNVARNDLVTCGLFLQQAVDLWFCYHVGVQIHLLCLERWSLSTQACLCLWFDYMPIDRLVPRLCLYVRLMWARNGWLICRWSSQ